MRYIKSLCSDTISYPSRNGVVTRGDANTPVNHFQLSWYRRAFFRARSTHGDLGAPERLDNGGGNIPLLPPWRLGAELGYDATRLHAGLTTFYYAKQDKLALDELPTDSYTMVDLDLSYNLDAGPGGMFVFLKGSNLLDEDARRSTSPLKDFAPLAGRSLQAGVQMMF